MALIWAEVGGVGWGVGWLRRRCGGGVVVWEVCSGVWWCVEECGGVKKTTSEWVSE